MRIQFAAYPVGRLLAIFLIVAFSGSLFANPKPPQVLCIDGGDCVEWEDENPDPDPAPGSRYSLASIGSIPFVYETPIPPSISSEVTVTPATIEANKVNGRRIILSAGNYGNQSFNTQDQEIIFQNGVQFGFLNVGSDAARLVFRGEPARAGVTGYITVGSKNGAATDIVFDGINQVHIQEGGEYPRQYNGFNANRLAILNSSFQVYEFVFLSYSSSASNRLQNVIIANNNLVDAGTTLPGVGSGQATLRTQGASRFIFVDNRLSAYTGDGYQNFRIHAQPQYDAEYFYIARNQFEGTGHSFQRSGDGQSTMEILNVWFEDNVQYTSYGTPINVDGTRDGTNYPTSFTMRNNQLYSNNGGWPSTPSGFAWQVSGNSSSPYQDPPSWQFK